MVLKMMQKSSDGSVVHLFKSNDLKYSDGGQMRDFIYVKDAVKMTCAFLEPKYRKVGGIYNIGQGVPTTWNLLAESFFKAIEKRTNIAYVEMPVDLVRQYQNYTCASMDKFYKIFHYSYEAMPIESAVQEYVQKYLMRQNRW